MTFHEALILLGAATTTLSILAGIAYKLIVSSIKAVRTIVKEEQEPLVASIRNEIQTQLQPMHLILGTVVNDVSWLKGWVAGRTSNANHDEPRPPGEALVK